MKKLLTIISIILVFATLATAEDRVFPGNQFTVAWDKPTSFTNGNPVLETTVVVYDIYMRIDKSPIATAQKVTDTPINQPLVVLTIPDDGQIWRFGVHALEVVNGNINRPATIDLENMLAWSDDPADCQNGVTVGFYVARYLGKPKNIRPNGDN